MKKTLRQILLVVALISSILLLRQLLQSASGESTYEDVAQLAFQGKKEQATPPVTYPAGIYSGLPTEPQKQEPQWVPAPVEEDDPHMETLEALNLEALQEQNPDVIGWILIPDTPVNYPLMQGTDNDYYLNHTWDREENVVGSIFLEHRNSPDLTDFNTIVYGHNMNDGSMFACLRKFATAHFRKERPYIYIASAQGVYRYEVFSFYQAPLESATYGLSFNEAKTRVNFLMEAKKKSSSESGVDPAATDRILTLSTCSGAGYSNRWVVQARLKMIQIP